MVEKPNTDQAGKQASWKDDPTRNVLDKVEDAVKRLDDLRIASERRIAELSDCKHTHIKEIMSLRADYSSQLREAETKRIDAIRAVDVAAVAIATERAAAAANVLATQVSTSAETLRALVANTATATSATSTAAFGQLADRIALLERSSYEGSGKSAVVDPLLTKMAENLEAVRLNGASKSGRDGLSQSLLLTLVAGAAGLVVFLVESFMHAAGVQ